METGSQFYQMLEQLPYGVGLYTAGHEYRVLYLNDALFRLLGYSNREYDAVSHLPPESFIYYEDRWLYKKNVEEMREKAAVENCECRIVRRDKSLRWIQLSLSTLRIDGQDVCMASFTDITTVKEAERASAYAEARYRLVMENTSTAIFEWNDQAQLFYSSELFADYTISDLPPKGIFSEDLVASGVHPEDLGIFIKFFRDAFSHKAKSECILRLKKTDGSYRWSRLVCMIMSDASGRLQRVIGAVTDINDEIERSAIQQELMKAIPGGVAIFKAGERPQCLYYNEGAHMRQHRSRESLQEIFDSGRFAQRLVAPEDRERFRAEVTEKIHRGLPVNVTYRYIVEDGRRSDKVDWIHLAASKIREEDGCPVYCAVMTLPPQENILYRGVVENSLTAAMVMEEHTKNILLANHAFRVLFGDGSETPMTGKNIFDALSKKNAGELLRQSARLEDGALRQDTITTDDGHIILIEGKKLLWNGVDACLFYLSDQTALQKKNEELVKLVDAIPGGIGIYALKGRGLKQIYLNEGFFRMLGSTRQQMQPFDEHIHEKAMHPDDKPLFVKFMRRLKQGEKNVDVTYRIRNCEQKYIWFRLIGNVAQRADGQTVVYCSYFDVDSQMKTQLELDNERTVLQLAMQTAKMSSWEYDVDKKTILQAKASRMQHGYGPLLENVPESLIADGFVHPDSVETYRELFRQVKKGDGVIRGDAYVRTPDGKGWWWERIIMTPIFDAQGRHIRSIGATIDITEQKTMEEKYRQQVHIFNAANSPELISKGLYDLTGNQAEYYHGESENSVKLKTAHSYADGLTAAAEMCSIPDERVKFLELFDRLRLIDRFKAGNTETVFDYRRKTSDGRVIWVQTVGRLYSVSESGNVMCFIYSYDIDAQKTAKEMIDTVVRVDYDYLSMLDCRTGDYIIYSNQGQSKTPLPPFHSSCYEQEVAEYAHEYVLPEDVERNIHDMSISNIRERLDTADSFISFVAVRDLDGGISRKKLQFSYLDRPQEKVLITRVDVTDVYEREQGQMKKLSEANHAKNDFLSHMSHDLRTPMNAIIGLSQLAGDELESPEAMKNYVDNIQSAGQFLLGLVNDCLDFEKLSARKMVLRPVPYPYQEFRSSIMTMIGPLCRQKNIDFSFSEAAPYMVCIDKVRFEQIFFNLLSNAVKYTPIGGKIDFIADSHLNGDGSLVICDFYVRDNGIGMSDEFQKHLFEPFEQESADEHSSQQGTGLGLSIVKELVELMGGSIQIRSSQGVGTEVKVHLDMPNIKGGENTSPVSADIPAESSLAGKKVLLLEDQPLNMMIARKLLEKQDITVICAENGAQGLEKFNNSPVGFIDAVLTDIRMPVMDGLELAKAIRSLSRADAKTVAIIAMTANAFEEDVNKSQLAGMDAHLSKPIEPELLYKTLQRCITSRES